MHIFLALCQLLPLRGQLLLFSSSPCHGSEFHGDKARFKSWSWRLTVGNLRGSANVLRCFDEEFGSSPEECNLQVLIDRKLI